jgi:replicative DNA helicase Mcm
VGWDAETGTLDFDVLATGASHSQQERMRTILEMIRGLSKEADQRSAHVDDIVRQAASRGISEEQTRKALETLKQRGQIYSPHSERYAAV